MTEHDVPFMFAVARTLLHDGKLRDEDPRVLLRWLLDDAARRVGGTRAAGLVAMLTEDTDVARDWRSELVEVWMLSVGQDLDGRPS
jgi:hypothetical protein